MLGSGLLALPFDFAFLDAELKGDAEFAWLGRSEGISFEVAGDPKVKANFVPLEVPTDDFDPAPTA